MFTRTLSRKLEGRSGLRRTAAREASSSMYDLHQIDFDEILSRSAKCVQHIAKGKMYQIGIAVTLVFGLVGSLAPFSYYFFT